MGDSDDLGLYFHSDASVSCWAISATSWVPKAAAERLSLSYVLYIRCRTSQPKTLVEVRQVVESSVEHLRSR